MAITMAPESEIDARQPAPTPGPEILAENNGRPWYFDRLSSTMVKEAASYRRAGVPEDSAVSIASRIVGAALALPQATHLGDTASSIFIKDGENVPQSDILLLVDQASTAYNEARTSPGFKNYLAYITANAGSFEIPTSASPNPRYESELARLRAGPAGREAIQHWQNLFSEVMHDVQPTPAPHPQTVRPHPETVRPHPGKEVASATTSQ